MCICVCVLIYSEGMSSSSMLTSDITAGVCICVCVLIYSEGMSSSSMLTSDISAGLCVSVSLCWSTVRECHLVACWHQKLLPVYVYLCLCVLIYSEGMSSSSMPTSDITAGVCVSVSVCWSTVRECHLVACRHQTLLPVYVYLCLCIDLQWGNVI